MYLGACGEKKSPEASVQPTTGQYFDVVGFVQKQAALLEKEKPGAVKTVSENQEVTETKKITNLDWQEELETFRELDINKPAFRNAYASTRQPDPNTGNITITYRKKPGYDGTVQYLSVTTTSSGQVLEVKGLQESENILLRSRREMKLQCHTENGTVRVTSYTIKGFQKPIIFGALQYTIFTKIG
ncbi:hypothetical protein AAE02nite_33460 [Adhaeribacter aerolatus]|uniref:Uncharacterized protein n=2 Tax=Adhaeribacter aerolatus TaxID=670289 RepID=A0A512B154_9BACT|nr:hypothetical protein AAE02nite_33460 [Adhaeribacter aerolatus]